MATTSDTTDDVEGGTSTTVEELADGGRKTVVVATAGVETGEGVGVMTREEEETSGVTAVEFGRGEDEVVEMVGVKGIVMVIFIGIKTDVAMGISNELEGSIWNELEVVLSAVTVSF